jgi:hypothetical protein
MTLLCENKEKNMEKKCICVYVWKMTKGCMDSNVSS